MKKQLCSLLFLLIFLSSSAQQNVSIAWGPENEVPKKTYFGNVLGADEKNYFLIKNYYKGKGAQWLVKYNMHHEVESETLIKMRINEDNDAVNEGIYMLKDHFVIFLSRKDKTREKNVLYAIITGKDGKQEAPVEVDAIDYKTRRNAGNFTIYPSKDLTKILVYHDEAFEKKGYERFNYKMYSQNLELLWEKPVELPYKDSKFNVATCRIDEEGNVFVLGTLNIDKNINQYKMFAYYAKKDRLEEVDVDFAKAYSVLSLQFDYISGHLIFVGFYTDTKRNGIQGLVYNKINARSLNKVVETTQPFNREDLIKFTSEKAADKGAGIQGNYKIDHILVNANGAIKVIAEYYYVSVYTSRVNNMTYTTYTYYYNNIMVIDLDKNGEIRWVSGIDKFQSSTNDGGTFSSYAFAYTNDELYFLYVDHCMNTAIGEQREKKSIQAVSTQAVKNVCITLASVNAKGEISRTLFQTLKKEDKTFFMPKQSMQLSADKLLVYSAGGKKYKYGTLTVK